MAQNAVDSRIGGVCRERGAGGEALGDRDARRRCERSSHAASASSCSLAGGGAWVTQTRSCSPSPPHTYTHTGSAMAEATESRRRLAFEGACVGATVGWGQGREDVQVARNGASGPLPSSVSCLSFKAAPRRRCRRRLEASAPLGPRGGVPLGSAGVSQPPWGFAPWRGGPLMSPRWG